MRLSKKKQFTNEFDFRILSLLYTLRCFSDTFPYPEKIAKMLRYFIDYLDKEVYHDLPTNRDTELLSQRYFVMTYYKEIL